MSASTIVIAGLSLLLPTDAEQAPLRPLAPRLHHLDGKVIGFLDNTKDNVAELFDDMEALLAGSHPRTRVVRFRKERFSGPAKPELLDRLARECDAAIVAAGSCGSCTALSVHDGVALELRGIPVVTICTTGFEEAARSQARTLGMPDHAIVLIGHPLGTMPRREVTRQAQLAWDRTVGHLVNGVP